MRHGFWVLAFVVLTGCAASETTDDGEAETAPAQADGKADGAAFTGLYQSHTTRHYNGDVPAVELDASGTYVRARCYHASCNINASETDHFDTYTSSSGKTYIRFWSWTRDGNGDQTPVIADVYEIRPFSKGIQLRKAYATRWQSLYTSSPSLACSLSGGSWNVNDCTCPGNTPNTWAATIFVPGAGGCISNPGSNESNCDDSGGMWSDDDATPNGAFCLCGASRYLDADGSCQSI